MSSNPYASPSPLKPGTGLDADAFPNDSFVRQITAVGILTIIQGLLELVYGAFVAVMAFIIPNSVAKDASLRGVNQPAEMVLILFWLYLVMGLVPLLIGVIRIIAGVLTIRRRARVFVIVSHIVGLASIVSCYCAFTGIGLAVYSLIVLFQPSVRAAFQQGRDNWEPPKQFA
jgi:hypothetical protein